MTQMNSTKPGQPDEASVDTKVLDAIGRALKAHYDDLVSEPVPDRFLHLLADLEQEERRAKPKGGVDASG
jgi:hypothetical protein